MDFFLSNGLCCSPPTLKRSTSSVICCLMCFTLLWAPYVSARDNKRIMVKVVRKEDSAGILAAIRINGVLCGEEVLIDRLNRSRNLYVARNLETFLNFESVNLVLKWGREDGKSAILNVKQAEAEVEQQDPDRERRNYVFEISRSSASLSIYPIQNRLPVMDETSPLQVMVETSPLCTIEYEWPNRIPRDQSRNKLLVTVERIFNGIPNFSCQLFSMNGRTPLSRKYFLNSNHLSTSSGEAREGIALVNFIIKKYDFHGIGDRKVHLRLDWNDMESLEPKVLQIFNTYDLGKRITYGIGNDHVWRSSSHITSNLGEERDVEVRYLPQFLTLNDIPTSDDTRNSAVMKLLSKNNDKWFTMIDTAGTTYTKSFHSTNQSQRFVMPENISPSSLDIHEWRKPEAKKDGKSDQEIKTETIDVRGGEEGEGCAGRLYILQIYDERVLVRHYSKLSQTGTRKHLGRKVIQIGSQN